MRTHLTPTAVLAGEAARMTTRRLLMFVIALVAAVSALAIPAGMAGAEPVAPGRPVVVVDTDMDFDDTAALAYLAQLDRHGSIELRAVTVEISGVAYPGNGLSHARCLLDKLGLGGVPISDGDRATANNFPGFVRGLLDTVVESGVRSNPSVACPSVPTEGHAAALLADTLRNSERAVTLLALGPMTNIAEALTSDPSLAGKIGRMYSVGGTLDWSTFPTSGFDTHDYNLWTDSGAAQTVLRALPGRVFMVSHDATSDVPLTEAFRQQLAAHDTTAATSTVLTLISNPALVAGEAENGGGGYWWDALGAVAATVPGVVDYRPARVQVIQGGDLEGRIYDAPGGTPVHYGTSADTTAFHQQFLDTLAAAVAPTHVTTLMTTERNCTELFIDRPGDPAAARAAVPLQYDLAWTTPTSGVPRVGVYTYTCDVTVDGHPPTTRSTVSLAVARLGSANHALTTPARFYVLALATDNPLLAARQNQLGLPAQFVPDIAFAETASPYTASWTLAGSQGLDYSLTTTAAAPPAATPSSGGPSFVHNDADGTTTLTYDNTMTGTVTAPVTADLSGAPTITQYLLTGAPVSPVGALSKGDWTTTVTRS